MIRFLQHQTKTKKLFLSAILAVLILGMVLYLGSAFTNTTASANAQGVYATVGDEQVTTQQNKKVKFDYAVLSPAELMKTIKPTDAELRAYYEKNKARYANSIPEQRKAQYVVVDASKVPVTITEDDYKRAYSQRQSLFQEKEQVDVRHILIQAEQTATAA